jgi:pyruvate ferredoxin oxidoreductase gamma subunit/2-oxoisovalerate ferredoxin oxidoreductase gamma subunit
MQEIRFHGRGGQGTVVASILLAKAFFKSGYFVQSFPAFGVERRGAPVEAYLRIDKEKIRIRTQITRPDHILVQDVQLLNGVQVTNGLKPGGWILINSGDGSPFSQRFPDFRIAVVDATRIAMDHHLGTRTHPIINTAMIGAFAGILKNPPMEALAAAITEDIQAKPEQNIQAAAQAFVKVQRFEN